MPAVADAAITEAPAVDAVALRQFLDGENAIVREHVRAVLALPEFERPVSPPPLDEYRAQVLDWARTLAKTKGPSLLFPEEFGGLGRVGSAITAFETLGHSDLSLLVTCGVQFGLFGGAVHHLGTRKHHERYLADIASLELPGCFAMSETGHGSNVQRVETTATYDTERREFVIDSPTEGSRKDYIGNAARNGRLAAVFCQLVVGGSSRGVHALLVPIRDEDGSTADGVEIDRLRPEAGPQRSRQRPVWLRWGAGRARSAARPLRRGHARGRVPQQDREPGPPLLHHAWHPGPGAGERRRRLDQRRQVGARRSRSATRPAAPVRAAGLERGDAAARLPRPPAAAAAGARNDLRAALRPGGRRRRARPDLHELGSDDEQIEEDRRQLETRAAGLKATATWHATETIQTCREACGGAGYLAENRFAALKADTDVFTTFEGDNTVLLQLVAKSLLTGLPRLVRRPATDRDCELRRRQVWETVVERSAARELIQRLTDDLVPSRESEEDLLDPEYHLDLFRWREEHMLSGVARRLKRGIDDGGEPFDVFNDAPGPRPRHRPRPRPARAARGVHRRGRALRGRRICGRSSSGCCNLYALAEIERDRAWFQEHGRISSTRAKAVTQGGQRALRRAAAAGARSWSTPSASPTRCSRRRSGCREARRAGPGWRTSAASCPDVRLVLEEIGQEEGS